MYVSVEASKLTFPRGAVLFSLEGLTTQRKGEALKGLRFARRSQSTS
jgi:hypothetical protein